MRRPGPRLVEGLAVVLWLTAPGLLGCARSAPRVVPTFDPVQFLKQDLTVQTTTAPGVQRAVWGVVVESLDRNERLFELNPQTLLVPASTAKLISLASAADAVGWDYRYETQVRASASVVDGVLQGDLLVVGSGDPSIGGRGGAEVSTWIAELKAAGLRQVNGRVIGDDDALEEPRPQLAWAWDDLGYPTGAVFGALNLAENRMVITVNPGQALDYQPTFSLDPAASSRPLRNRTVTGPTGSPVLLWPEQRPGEPFLTIAGSIPIGADPARVQIAVGNPTAWFAAGFRAALISGGIEVTGDSYDIDDVASRPEWNNSAVLYTHRSATLAQIAQPMLKDSINLYGEALLRLNAPTGVLPTNDAALAGLEARMTSWGIPRQGWQIIDGSGLSRRNTIAAEVLVGVLQRMYDPAGTSAWMTAFPVAGRDGTLANRMRGTAAEGNVRAKTGTMSNIRSLAGYARTRDGENLAFAILVNNFEGSAVAATQTIDRIAVRLSEFSRRETGFPVREPASIR